MKQAGASPNALHPDAIKASTALCARPCEAVDTSRQVGPRSSRGIWSHSGSVRIWKKAQREWTAAMTQAASMFGDRFSVE
jgi:hypothetical protein